MVEADFQATFNQWHCDELPLFDMTSTFRELQSELHSIDHSGAVLHFLVYNIDALPEHYTFADMSDDIMPASEYLDVMADMPMDIVEPTHRPCRIILENFLQNPPKPIALSADTDVSLTYIAFKALEFIPEELRNRLVLQLSDHGRQLPLSGPLRDHTDLRSAKVITATGKLCGGMRCQECGVDAPWLHNGCCGTCKEADESTKRHRLPQGLPTGGSRSSQSEPVTVPLAGPLAGFLRPRVRPVEAPRATTQRMPYGTCRGCNSCVVVDPTCVECQQITAGLQVVCF